MNQKYVAPVYNEPRFTCPHCDTLASMEWHCLSPLNKPLYETGLNNCWSAAVCAACGDRSLWLAQSNRPAAKAHLDGVKMCYPTRLTGAVPSEDMPNGILADYQEARTVASLSPRAAAALLRLCIQKLCKHLGESGDNINSDIAALVKKGLKPLPQFAMDTVRIVGNSAVHPLALTPEEVEHHVPALFMLVNYIVDDMITKPRIIEEAYAATPQSSRDAVAKRDANS